MDNDSFEKMRAASLSREEDVVNSKKQNSLSSLKKIIHKKCTTMIIGALARFEKHFGRIWGQGRENSEKSEIQRSAEPHWQKCRKEVLDFCNSQLRGLESELDTFEVKYKGYHFEFRKGDKNV